jgi:6-phosphogluconolactonase (cycloisomerase 2 family)
MKRSILIVSAALALFFASRGQAQTLYVTHVDFTLTGGVIAFNISGPPSPLGGFTPITGLKTPVGLAVANNKLFVANRGDGSVGVYDANTGAARNAQLITGLKKPTGLAFMANTLYVSDFGAGTVTAYSFNPQAYTVTPDANFTQITGLHMPTGLAIGGGNILFVAAYGSTVPGAGTISAYDATEGGQFGNGPLIMGLDLPTGVAVGGNMLYVSDQGGTVGAYQFDKNTVTISNPVPAFIKGLDSPTGLALGPGNQTLYVVSALAGTVGAYTSGAATPANFITGLSGPTGIAIK